ncbi:PBS lyase [Paraburkholderia graminis]|jgi:HEAT repeat protein|uniref:HEAT repeat domain-containing protein n=1 Tax=Paraburkholderia TaxID=1822464 RepID=UPI000DEFCB94|nr:HEAT repeat domain-containing protein [Paraburkholderia graminis]AXF08315.1 PBS lyase [Paraburkholderia graminis]MDR6467141.1 HEAT repeat protein [Paraburkholderia graminis]MDR6473573.1 HEAT repeat protein [Paraburkholderia graminis]
MTDSTDPNASLDAVPAEAIALLSRLASEDAVVRRVALIDLADLEDACVIEPIVDALRRDASPEVRSEAALVLASWERDDVVEALCGALLDGDASVRANAAQSLSELKHASSGAILLEWLKRPDSFMRAALLRALRELRVADAFAPALQALADADANVREQAVGVLGWLKNPLALEPLASLATSDADASIRRAAAAALGFAPPAHRETMAALLSALRDDAWQVREEATTTLGKLRAAESREALEKALDDAYWQVRLRALRALGQIGDSASAARVAALLSHSISNVRKEAALALGEIGSSDDAPTLSALEAAEADGDPEVRKAARIALRQIAGRRP